MNFELIKHLTRSGARIFTVEEARMRAQEIGLNPSSIQDKLHYFKNKGVIESLMKGLYCLSPELLAGIPLHEYEVAMELVSPSAIAYLSAMSFHKLTDQVSSHVYIMTIGDFKETNKSSSYNTYRIKGVTYKIIRTKKEFFFGLEKQWVGGRQIFITDLERTLLDGLIRPKYCGGFREVLDAFSQSTERMNVNKMISYAQKIGDTACKRLGWVLTHCEIKEDVLIPLLQRKSSSGSFSKLNPSGPHKGVWNHKWLLLENI